MEIPRTGVAPDPGAGKDSKYVTRDARNKGKHRHLMLKLISGWVLVLVLIVFGARKMWHVESSENRPAAPSAAAVPEEDTLLMQEAVPKCAAAFSGFLAAGSPEGRAQFVLSPITATTRMSRFYSLNPWTAIDAETLTLTGQSVVYLPGEKGIEMQWETQDGKRFDAVFREQDDEWRLDWDHFSRYGDYPWPLFLAGNGPAEGEFRLLARERLAEERKNEESISIVLYAPRFGLPGETGFQSPEFLVSRKTLDGQLLDAAFLLARKSGRVFDSRLSDVNPEGMIRVRVKVRRFETDEGRRFEITGVTTCHWHSEDAPGVEPKPKSAQVPPAPAPAEAPPGDPAAN